jgi:hypothetical protein
VTDDSNSSPVSGAEPEILNGPNAGKKTPSAANGTYSIPTISPGAITVRFRAGGYDTTDRDVTIGATNVTLNVAMHKTPTTTTTTTSAPALRADFGSSPNPCTMTPSGGGLSVDCTLDASSSTGAITQYSWSYLGRSDSGVRIGISADCGTGPGVQSVGVSVTLTVRDGTGATNSTTKTVTLVKKGVCGF